MLKPSLLCVWLIPCDLPQETGPGSVVLKAPSVLLNAPTPGVLPGPEAQGWEVAEFMLVLGQCPTEQAGHVHVEGLWFGSSVVPLGLSASVNLMWTKCLSRRELCCVRGVLRNRGLCHRGAVWVGVLSWSALVGPARCSPVSVPFGECSPELYFERKAGLLSVEYGNKLTSVWSAWAEKSKYRDKLPEITDVPVKRFYSC